MGRKIISYLRKIVNVMTYELMMTVFSAKFWVMLMLVAIFTHMFYGDSLKFAADYNLGIFPVSMTFYYNEITFAAIGLLIFIFFISDAPFRDNNQVYLLERCGRKLLCIGQMCSLLLLSIVYTVVQFIVTVAFINVNIDFSGWGKYWGSIAYGRLSELGYYCRFDVSEKIISNFTTWQTLGFGALLMILTFFMFGLILFLFNNIGKGRAGTIITSLWNAMWVILSAFSLNQMVRKIARFSTSELFAFEGYTYDEMKMRLLMLAIICVALFVVNYIVDVLRERRR